MVKPGKAFCTLHLKSINQYLFVEQNENEYKELKNILFIDSRIERCDNNAKSGFLKLEYLEAYTRCLPKSRRKCQDPPARLSYTALVADEDPIASARDQNEQAPDRGPLIRDWPL